MDVTDSCQFPEIIDATGRAGSPLPAAVANQRMQVRRDGAHGVPRPTHLSAVFEKWCHWEFVSCEPLRPDPPPFAGRSITFAPSVSLLKLSAATTVPGSTPRTDETFPSVVSIVTDCIVTVWFVPV